MDNAKLNAETVKVTFNVTANGTKYNVTATTVVDVQVSRTPAYSNLDYYADKSARSRCVPLAMTI